MCSIIFNPKQVGNDLGAFNHDVDELGDSEYVSTQLCLIHV